MGYREINFNGIMTDDKCKVSVIRHRFVIKEKEDNIYICKDCGFEVGREWLLRAINRPDSEFCFGNKINDE